MGTLLGANFKDYVAKQIKTRQSILGSNLNGNKPEEQIVWENNNTSYIALASSIDIKNNPIVETSVNFSVYKDSGFITTLNSRGGTTTRAIGEDPYTLDQKIDEYLLEYGSYAGIISASEAGVEFDIETLAEAQQGVNYQFSFLPLLEEENVTALAEGQNSYYGDFQVTQKVYNISRNAVMSREPSVPDDLSAQEYASLIYNATKSGVLSNEGGTIDGLLKNTLNAIKTVGRFKQVEEAWSKLADDTRNESLRDELTDDGVEPIEIDDTLGVRIEFAGSGGFYNDVVLYASREVLGNGIDDLTFTLNGIEYTSPYVNTSAYIEYKGDEFGFGLSAGGDAVKDLSFSQSMFEEANYFAEIQRGETTTSQVTYATQQIEYEIDQVSEFTGFDYSADPEEKKFVDNSGDYTSTSETIIGYDDAGTKRVQTLELEGDPTQYLGNFVAKNVVLTNGTTLVNGDGTRTYKAGVTDNLSTFNDSVYGFGGDPEWGLAAMPGLQGVDIKSKNMGSLREATVTIRANTEKQFALIDALYCRIGYTMFLEWGHSVYYNNNSTYQSDPLIGGAPSLVSEFLEKKKTKSAIVAGQGLQALIEKNRKISCGNYDAFVGKVTNFSWEFNKSGYYTITLKLMSIGDIIESLQIDQPTSGVQPPNIGATQSQPSNSSTLESFLTIAATPNGTSFIDDSGWWLSLSEEGIENNYGTFKNTLESQNTRTIEEATFWGSVLATAGYVFYGPIGLIAGSALSSLTNSSETETIGESQSDYSSKLNYDRGKTNSAGKIISGRAGFGNDIYHYIRLGDILDFIKDQLLIYNPEDDYKPIIDIDTDTDTNFCYYSGANISANPSKVMVAAPLPMPIEKLRGFAQTKDDKGEYNWPHGVAQDGIFRQKEAALEPYVIEELKCEGKTLSAGRIMNIYFEYDYLLNTIESKRDKDTSALNLFDFIKELIDTANECLGGINKLTLRVNEDQILQIYDQVPLYGSQSPPPQDSIINLYGVTPGNGSFVKDFNIKTELTNEFATQITVGAQAQGSKDTTDALAISNWNFGLHDRWFFSKASSSQRDGLPKESDIFTNLLTARDKVAFLWAAYSQGQANQSFERELKQEEILNFYRSRNQTVFDVNGVESADKFDQIDNLLEQNLYAFKNFPTKRYDEFVTAQKNFLSLLHINSDYNSNQMGMLPMNISVTISGLSGIRIFDQLPVDVRFIPNYYPQTLHWIIKGVSHSIQNNEWVTKLETIAVPKIPEIPSGNTPTTSTKGRSYTLLPTDDLPSSDVDLVLTGTNTSSAQFAINVEEVPEVPVSKKPLVEKILNLIDSYNNGFYSHRGYQTAILSAALGESSELNYDASESFNYSLKRAKEVFSKMRNLTDEEALKYIPPSKGGSGSEEKFANFIYGGMYGNGADEGYKYRGQGLTQITFKSNYEAIQRDIIEKYDVRDSSGNKVDIVNNPEKVRDEEVSVAILVYGKILAKFGRHLTSAQPNTKYLSSGGLVQKLQNGSNGKSSKAVPNSVTKNYVKAVARVNKTSWIQELINPDGEEIPATVSA